MVVHKISKKYKQLVQRPWPLNSKLLLWSSLIVCLSSAGLASPFARDSLPPIPTIGKVGVLPVRVESDGSRRWDLQEYLTAVRTVFPKAVRATGRFELLEDGIVSSYWGSKESRNILINEFELSGFIGLTVVVSSNTLSLVARIFGPRLEIYLQEMTVVPLRPSIAEFSLLLDQSLAILVNRLVNRLPADITVTSIQGHYVTLSGGTAQGLRVGEKLKLYRNYIAERHPANGAWTKFSSRYVGEIRVIESSSLNAIAEISKVQHALPIGVGDGTVVPELASRAYFRPQNQDEAAYLDDSFGEIQRASYLDDSPSNEDATSKDKLGSVRLGYHSELMNEGDDTDEHHDSPANASASDLSPSPHKRSSLSSATALELGQVFWSYAGPGDSDSKFALSIPINLARLELTRSPRARLWYAIGGNFGGGKTAGGGSYILYDADLAIALSEKIRPLDLIDLQGSIGASASYLGLKVYSEQLGGHDLVVFGLFVRGGFKSNLLYPLTWYVQLELSPYGLGRIATLRTDDRASQDGLGWRYKTAAFFDTVFKELQLGAVVDYRSERWDVDSEDELRLTRYSLRGVAKLSF